MQALGEQARVLRQGLESRLGIKMSSAHPRVSWMADHAVDVISKCEVGPGGRIGYERMKGKARSHEIMEIGEQIQYKFPRRTRRHEEEQEGKWGKGYFLGQYWRTGEALTAGGMQKNFRAPEECLGAGILTQTYNQEIFVCDSWLRPRLSRPQAQGGGSTDYYNFSGRTP